MCQQFTGHPFKRFEVEHRVCCGPRYGPSFRGYPGRREEIEFLTRYLEELEGELHGVRERLEELKGE